MLFDVGRCCELIKCRLTSIILSILLVMSTFLSINVLPAMCDSRSSIAWGVEWGYSSEDEIQASSEVCAAIKEFFLNVSGYNYVENYFGEDTTGNNLCDITYYCDNNFDFAVVFYKSHAYPLEGSPPNNPPHSALYDNEEWFITDYSIGDNTVNGVHDFVLLWACGMADFQGGFFGTLTVNMSTAWLYRDDLGEDTHDNPDYSSHCFISFKFYSPEFIDDTGHSSYTLADFITLFYQYVTDGNHTIDEALDHSANVCFGCDLEDSWIFTGYWYYCDDPEMEGWYWSYMREFGDGSMMLMS